MNKKLLVLNGPNLNLLGNREPNIYGTATLEDINHRLQNVGKVNNIIVECFQSNSETDLVNKTQSLLQEPADFMIINPASYTHTSIAWRDALLAVKIPFIEIHISNIFTREPFRHKSFFSDIAIAVISGLGSYGYELALNYAIAQLSKKE